MGDEGVEVASRSWAHTGAAWCWPSYTWTLPRCQCAVLEASRAPRRADLLFPRKGKTWHTGDSSSSVVPSLISCDDVTLGGKTPLEWAGLTLLLFLQRLLLQRVLPVSQARCKEAVCVTTYESNGWQSIKCAFLFCLTFPSKLQILRLTRITTTLEFLCKCESWGYNVEAHGDKFLAYIEQQDLDYGWDLSSQAQTQSTFFQASYGSYI